MKILGIETSCDETAASIIEGAGGKIKVLSNVVASQIEIHKKYGGVVPEVAAREHVLNILPVVNEALERAGITPMSLRGAQRHGNLKFAAINWRSPRSLRSLAMTGLDAIAVTVGPGLITSLQVGVETAKTLACAWNLPVVAVNHIEAHIYSAFIPHLNVLQGGAGQVDNPDIKFPALILTVSGGHTILVLMRGHGKLEVIGETRDDAAGEAFDKAASLLGLGYPGGPAISAAADKFSIFPATAGPRQGGGNFQFSKKTKISLPRPMLESPDFDFSFSGLKTALLYQIRKDKDWKKRKAEYAYEFQQAVVETLVGKTIKAARKFGIKSIILAGGVSANLELRRQLGEAVGKLDEVNFYLPDLKYTTDNAAMIAAAGYFMARQKKYTPWQKLKAECNLELK